MSHRKVHLPHPLHFEWESVLQKVAKIETTTRGLAEMEDGRVILLLLKTDNKNNTFFTNLHFVM